MQLDSKKSPHSPLSFDKLFEEISTENRGEFLAAGEVNAFRLTITGTARCAGTIIKSSRTGAPVFWPDTDLDRQTERYYETPLVVHAPSFYKLAND